MKTPFRLALCAVLGSGLLIGCQKKTETTTTTTESEKTMETSAPTPVATEAAAPAGMTAPTTRTPTP